MVIAKSVPTIARLQPKIATAMPTARTTVMPTTQTRSIHSTGFTTNQIMNFGIQMGLKPSDVKILINHYNTTGEIPNPGNYKRILRANKPSSGLMDIFGIKPTVSTPTTTIQPAPVIDQVVDTATGGSGATMTSNTGFAVVDPTREESFIQKNKAWLIPAGVGAAALTLYLITKKKK